MQVSEVPERSGFMLLEALLASFILGIAVLALCHVSVRSMHQMRENADAELAWNVMDKQLNLIQVVGIDAFTEAGVFEGVNEDFGMPFLWKVELTEETLSSLFTVEMTVSWETNRKQKSISAATQFNGQPLQLSLGAGI